MSVQRISTIFFDLGDTLVRSGVRAWVPGAKETLDALSAKSLRLGIISNTGNLSRDQLSALLPQDFRFEAFEAALILLSSEVGVRSPRLRFLPPRYPAPMLRRRSACTVARISTRPWSPKLWACVWRAC